MPFTIRPFAGDFAAIAPLVSLLTPTPVTAEELEQQHANVPPDMVRHRLVATDPAGEVIAYANVFSRPENWARNFHFTLVTAPGARRQGVGNALLDQVSAWAQSAGGKYLRTSVDDTREESARFAQNRGFALNHTLVNRLEVPAFDEAATFPGVVDRVAASGIRFLRFADLEREAALQRLYQLYKVTDMDSPGYAGTDPANYPKYEAWYDDLFGGGKTLEESILLAVDGDRWVGVTILQKDGPDRGLYTEYTGVLREYRSRGIALALKLLSVRFAKEYGAPYMITRNDATNGPMLAVNSKMGYHKVEGRFWLVKELSSATGGAPKS